MKRMTSFFSLFTSFSTLICCALPATFVLLGAGATFAGIVGNFPQLIWISERKVYFFIFGAVMLAIGGYLQWNARQMECPIDPKTGEACKTTRDWSIWVYFISLGLYLIGLVTAYVLPAVLK